jgi:hypothetical protein
MYKQTPSEGHRVSFCPLTITIKMICDGLGIALGEFFNTPEFDALEQEIK